MRFNTFLATVVVHLAAIAAEELYTVEDISGAGSVKLTANKVYNVWNNGGNSTSYTVEIVSPLITQTSQEIRVAIQWQWRTRLGVSNERVAFYGEVANQRFDQYRVDNHIEVNGSYQFANWFMPAIPKNSESLPPQNPDTVDQYVIKQVDDPEIVVENHTAKFTFEVSRDEPYNDNRIWINWGVFDSPFDTDTNKIHGSRDSHQYRMELTYNDYFDRVFMNGIYWTLAIVGIFTFWAALPLQTVPMIIFLVYVYLNPIGIWLFAPVSSNFTFDQFFVSVSLRWQLGTLGALSTMVLGDLISYAPIGYLYYQYSNQSNTVTNSDWENFGIYSVLAWSIQVVLNFLPPLLGLVFLAE